MFRFGLVLVGLTVGATGCIPVEEPLADVKKAEPDRRLVGTWERVEGTKMVRRLIIDHPDIDDRPKGLLRVREEGQSGLDDPGFLFATVIGNERYLNLTCGSMSPGDLGKPGGFA